MRKDHLATHCRRKTLQVTGKTAVTPSLKPGEKPEISRDPTRGIRTKILPKNTAHVPARGEPAVEPAPGYQLDINSPSRRRVSKRQIVTQMMAAPVSQKVVGQVEPRRGRRAQTPDSGKSKKRATVGQRASIV